MRGRGSGLTKSSSVLIAVMLLASADMAYAQNGAAPAGEDQQAEPSGDIVVTAQKRSERLQDVPVSIAAVSGDSLRNMDAAGYTDYLNSVPSVSYTKNGG